MELRGHAWVLERAGEPLVRHERSFTAGPGEVVVQVMACGVCHTDLGFANGSVTPKKGLPIVLGHEVVGTIVGGSEDRAGEQVLVPSVMPCGDCPWCHVGLGNACPAQRMPGNDIDGGFATHLVVPERSLVSLDGYSGDPRLLSVVADAVSTAWQAARRLRLASGDLAVIVGAGGVGGFAAQIARAHGARVVACDVDPGRLEQLKPHGAHHVIDVRDRAPRDVRKEVMGLAKGWGIPSLRLRIFECSGTAPGQQLAFGMLQRSARLAVVGFTPKKTELRLANAMAFDAEIHGSWGCPPDQYPLLLELVGGGSIQIEPFVDFAELSAVNETLQALAEHRLERRIILEPHGGNP